MIKIKPMTKCEILVHSQWGLECVWNSSVPEGIRSKWVLWHWASWENNPPAWRTRRRGGDSGVALEDGVEFGQQLIPELSHLEHRSTLYMISTSRDTFVYVYLFICICLYANWISTHSPTHPPAPQSHTPTQPHITLSYQPPSLSPKLSKIYPYLNNIPITVGWS